jgi:protein-tyrosine phosphatase
MEKTSVLFVCLGNICRSPLAEALFAYHVKQGNLEGSFSWDSAGTNGLHDGENADPRSIRVAHKHGIEVPSISRAIVEEDFKQFTYIVAMDKWVYNQLKSLENDFIQTQATILLMRDFDNEQSGSDVQDPYYGGEKDFEQVYAILKESTKNFLDFLKRRSRT